MASFLVFFECKLTYMQAMLAVNQCHEAFWMGNLKNRDLRGQEIISQQSMQDQEEEREEPEDEEDNDESGVRAWVLVWVIQKLINVST
jgi:hypothetical protein